MKDITKKLLTAFAAICFFIICTANLASTKSDYSENENRYLAKLPEISAQTVKSGEFMKNFEEYTSDRFILRDFFVSLKAKLERLLMRTENNGIYYAKDNYLIEKPAKYNDELLKSNIDALKALSELKRYKVNLCLVPGAYEILKDKLPKNAYEEIYPKYISYINEVLKETEILYTDPTEILTENKNEYIYYRTDHHQTAYGGYLVYRALSENLGYTPLEKSDFDITEVSEKFFGTTWSKAMINKKCADTIEKYTPKSDISFSVEFPYEDKNSDNLYFEEHLKTKDKYSYYLDGNHGLEIVESSNKNGKKLMVIKDSYAHNIVPFLANNYEKIYMVDLRYFNTDILEYLYENNIGEVLALYSLSGFVSDDNLSKVSSWCENSPYAKQPFGLVFESDAVSDSYFNDAVFIGDSLTEGLKLYNSLGENQFLSYVGMSLYGIDSLKFPNENGEAVYSAVDMIAAMGNVGKFYIMLGTNDRIHPDVLNNYISNYSNFIDNIRKYKPDSIIYIQSILPVTPAKELEGRFNNDYIYMYNNALAELAKEKKCYFIDVYNICTDSNGDLIGDVSPDGIHLNVTYYQRWFSYLKTHAVGGEKSDGKEVSKPKSAYIATSEEGTAIAEALKAGVPFTDKLWQIDNSIGSSLYGIDASWVKSATVYAGSGATAEEIAIFEYKDADSSEKIQQKILEHLADKKSSFENYLPSEVVKLSYPCIKATDKFIVLCVSDYNEIAADIIAGYANMQ